MKLRYDKTIRMHLIAAGYSYEKLPINENSDKVTIFDNRGEPLGSFDVMEAMKLIETLPEPEKHQWEFKYE